MFACKLATTIDFCGRAALEAARAAGPARRLVSFVAADPSVTLWGGELMVRDGEPVGQVTSAAHSATLGAAVGLAYLWNADGSAVDLSVTELDGYAVDVAGEHSGDQLSMRQRA